MEVVSQLFGYLLTGMEAVFGFISLLPDIFSTALSVLPTPFASFLLVCFGIIIAIRVLELLP